ncbi:hypothetical protein [Roseateles oligotrophus]|uniref:hypothetical protein n=1 Tax=Roseateles oligotrophus TaxID=1769250 RepID=UPI0037C9075B
MEYLAQAAFIARDGMGQFPQRGRVAEVPRSAPGHRHLGSDPPRPASRFPTDAPGADERASRPEPVKKMMGMAARRGVALNRRHLHLHGLIKAGPTAERGKQTITLAAQHLGQETDAAGIVVDQQNGVRGLHRCRTKRVQALGLL